MRLAIWFVILSIVAVLPARASDDSDARLFNVQLAMAKKGEPAAQYYLGEMYEHGLGTNQSMSDAFVWYEKSASQGNRLAKVKVSKRKEIEAQESRDRAAEAAVQNERQRVELAAERRAAAEQEKARRRAAVRDRLARMKQEHREAFE